MRHQHIAKKAGKARPSSSIFSRESSNFFFSSASERSKPFFNSNTVQPKLKIGAPNDKYEQQADHVADAVMRMPEGEEKIQPQSIEKEEEMLQTQPMEQEEELQAKYEPILKPKCTACQSEEQLQQKSEQGRFTGTTVGESLSRGLKLSKGRGSRLPKNIQAEMSHKMGADFSAVHIHTDNNAIRMNWELGSRAFTNGNNIYFNNGQYKPDTRKGQPLLAHELTHVMQQTFTTNGLIQRQT